MKKLLLGQISSTAIIAAYHAAPLSGPLAPRHTLVAAMASAFTAAAFAFGVVGVSYFREELTRRTRADHHGIAVGKLKAEYAGLLLAAALVVAGIDVVAAYTRDAIGLGAIAITFTGSVYFAIDAADNRKIRRGTIASLTIQTLAILLTTLHDTWIPSMIGTALLAAFYAAVSKYPRRFGLSRPDPYLAWR